MKGAPLPGGNVKTAGRACLPPGWTPQGCFVKTSDETVFGGGVARSQGSCDPERC